MPMPPTITVYKSHTVLGEGTVVRNYGLDRVVSVNVGERR